MNGFLNQLAEVATVLTPVFVLATLGYAWNRWARRGGDLSQFSGLIFYLGTPALLFASLLENAEPATLLRMGWFFCAALLTAGLIALLTYLIAPILRAPRREIAFAFAFPNSGNMGLPICLLAFGEAGFRLALVYFLMNAMLMHTAGAAAHGSALKPGTILRNPLLWTVVAALGLAATGWQVIPSPPPASPTALGWLYSTAKLLGGITIPLMLLILGTSLARLTASHARLALVWSLFRLLIGGLVALGVAWLMQLDGLETRVLFLQTLMPTAVFNLLIAEMHENRQAEIASLVFVSTLLALVSLPLSLFFLV